MIKTTETYTKTTKERALSLAHRAQQIEFPKELKISNIVGVANLELLLETVNFVNTNKNKEYFDRLSEQREILAAIAITDDASANAYLDKLEPQLEAWAKLKDAFDEEMVCRLKGLQAEFLNGGHP